MIIGKPVSAFLDHALAEQLLHLAPRGKPALRRQSVHRIGQHLRELADHLIARKAGAARKLIYDIARQRL
jgi:predicted PP-loop superfamily ATPase